MIPISLPGFSFSDAGVFQPQQTAAPVNFAVASRSRDQPEQQGWEVFAFVLGVAVGVVVGLIIKLKV